MSKANFRTTIQHGIYAVINPFVKLLIRLGLTPNAVTLIGLILNIGVAIIFVFGAEKTNRNDLSFVGWAGALVLFAGLFDMLDGQVARLGNMGSAFGALFDSVLDRYSELIMFLGICYYLIAHHYFLSSLFAFIALIGSLMVSYTRARAEGLGVECKEGLMQRPERVITIGVTAVACGVTAQIVGGNQKWYVFGSHFPALETISIFTIPLFLMAILTNITAVSRLMGAKKALDAKEAAQIKIVDKSSTPSLSWLPFMLLIGVSAFTTAHTTKHTSILKSKFENSHKPAIVNEVNIEPQDTFPVPPHTSNLLFYLQRTTNTNTIICDLNIDASGKLNEEDPVHVYWIRYPEGGMKKELNYIQRVFAYGIKASPMGNGAYKMHFVSSRKRILYLMHSGKDNKYHVYTDIQNRQAILHRIFVKIDGGTMWKPNVVYMELKGTDPTTGKEVMERIKP